MHISETKYAERTDSDTICRRRICPQDGANLIYCAWLRVLITIYDSYIPTVELPLANDTADSLIYVLYL